VGLVESKLGHLVGTLEVTPKEYRADKESVAVPDKLYVKVSAVTTTIDTKATCSTSAGAVSTRQSLSVNSQCTKRPVETELETPSKRFKPDL
ncbi:hypothetical protein E3U43_017372, partial [Larimichthys crocea]